VQCRVSMLYGERQWAARGGESSEDSGSGQSVHEHALGTAGKDLAVGSFIVHVHTAARRDTAKTIVRAGRLSLRKMSPHSICVRLLSPQVTCGRKKSAYRP
jgi:hypothetical protein